MKTKINHNSEKEAQVIISWEVSRAASFEEKIGRNVMQGKRNQNRLA